MKHKSYNWFIYVNLIMVQLKENVVRAQRECCESSKVTCMLLTCLLSALPIHNLVSTSLGLKVALHLVCDGYLYEGMLFHLRAMCYTAYIVIITYNRVHLCFSRSERVCHAFFCQNHVSLVII